MIAVSACLLGYPCKYNGGHNKNQKVLDWLKDKEYICICPESSGGLSSPRTPAEIVGGDGFDVLASKAKVLDKEGNDVSQAFINGAMATLKKAQKHGADTCILKAKSPSCGVGTIYDGTFSGCTKPGFGVAAALLKQNGLKLLTEENLS